MPKSPPPSSRVQVEIARYRASQGPCFAAGWLKIAILRFWSVWLTAWLSVGVFPTAVHAADITKGYTFTPTDHVISSKLNNMMDLATISPSFISGQVALTTPQLADSFVLYSVTAAGLRKVSIENLGSQLFGFTHADWRSNFLAGVDETTRSNLLCGAIGTTENTFLRQAVTNAAAAVADNTTTNLALVGNTTNANLTAFKLPMFWTTNFTFTYGQTTNVAHNLPGLPQWVHWTVRCVTTETGTGRNAGDEMEASAVYAFFTNNPANDRAMVPAFTTGASSSNLFFTSRTNTPSDFAYYGFSGTNGAGVVMTNSHYVLQARAIFYP